MAMVSIALYCIGEEKTGHREKEEKRGHREKEHARWQEITARELQIISGVISSPTQIGLT